jgi:hypothetical protein
MNIQNIKLKKCFEGYHRWQYELEKELYCYFTMQGNEHRLPLTTICYERDLFGGPRLITLNQYLPLDIDNPNANTIRLAYKLGMLE